MLHYKEIKEISVTHSTEKWKRNLMIYEFIVIGHFYTNNTVEYFKFQEMSGKFQNGIPFRVMLTPHFEHFTLFAKKSISNCKIESRGNGIFFYSRDRDRLISMQSNNFDSDEIMNWISRNIKSLLVEIAPYNFKDYLSSDIPTIMLFINDTLPNEELFKDYKRVAIEEEDKGEFEFGYIDGERFEHITEQLFLSNALPNLVLLKKKEYYTCKDCFNPNNIYESIKKFILLSKTNKLNKVYKNSIPSDPKELSFNSFYSTLKSEHQLFVLFMVNSCAPCMHYQVIYSELQNKYSNLYTFNVDLNSLPIEISELPSVPNIIHFKKNEKNLQINFYKGQRNLEELENWIKEQFSVQIESI